MDVPRRVQGRRGRFRAQRGGQRALGASGGARRRGLGARAAAQDGMGGGWPVGDAQAPGPHLAHRRARRGLRKLLDHLIQGLKPLTSALSLTSPLCELPGSTRSQQT